MMADTDERPIVWQPCSGCWGQRSIYRRTPEGYVAEPCPVCLGIGEVPAVSE